MDCSTLKGKGFNLALLLNRLSIGVFFVIVGSWKVMGEGGIAAFVNGPYKSMTPPWLPSAFAVPFGYALPIVELLFGSLLVIGLFGRLTATVLSLLLVSIMISQHGAGMLWHGANVDGPFHTNLILFTATLIMVFAGPGCISIDALFRRKK